MPRPSANINILNGQLGIIGPGNFGTPFVVIASAIAPVAGYLTAFSIKSIAEAKTAFAQVGNEALLDAITKGFYAEAPEGTELFIVCAVNTNTLTLLAAPGIAEKALDLANGKARIGAFIKFPDVSYTPTTTSGFDADVHTCVSAVQTLAESWQSKRKPFRAFIQGYGFTTASAALDYSTNTKRNTGIVVGAITDNTARATMMALGRASKEDPQRNIGRVKSGSLNIADTDTVKIGTALLEKTSSTDLDTLYDKRYITFDRNESEPGYIFNDDNMLTAITDDYNNLRNGRVIDNAVRICFATYYKELKDDVDVDDNGRLDIVVEKALESAIVTAIDEQMGGQLSKDKQGHAIVECLVNPDPTVYATLYAENALNNPNLNTLTNGGTVYLFVSCRPKGCIKNINIFLGLSL